MHESAHSAPLQPANTLRVDIVEFLHLPKRFSYLMFLQNDASGRRSVSVSCFRLGLSPSPLLTVQGIHMMSFSSFEKSLRNMAFNLQANGH